MAIILKKGAAHKAHVWTTECDLCESKLQLFEDLTDPAVTEFGSSGTNTVYVSYVCPVCGESQRAYAHEFDCYGKDPRNIIFGDKAEHAIAHGTRREYRPLTKSDPEKSSISVVDSMKCTTETERSLRHIATSCTLRFW